LNEQGNFRVLQALQDAALAPLPRSEKKEIQQKSHSTSRRAATYSSTTTSTVALRSLQHVSTSIPFSGEIRAGNIHVALTSGQFLAPADFQEIFANSNDNKITSDDSSGRIQTAPAIHFEVLMGSETIEEEAKLEEQNAEFVDRINGQEPEQSESSLAEWARQKPAVQLPVDVGKNEKKSN
jgi:hypothetical protein